LLRHGYLVRLGRRLAVLGVGLALAVGHRGAAGDPAGPVARPPAVLRRPVGAAAGARPAGLHCRRLQRPVRPDRLEIGARRGRGGDRRGGAWARAGEEAMTAGVSLVVLLFLLGSSIAVAAGMGLAGVILNQLYSTMPMSRIVGELTWSTTSNFILTAIPFYIMFGEILLRSGTAERMYAALVQWLSWLPGGLMHSNIGSCALFGSVSGSSVATAATIGVVAVGGGRHDT